MAKNACINTWDEVWAEFDAREAVRAAQKPRAPEPAKAAPQPMAEPPPGSTKPGISELTCPGPIAPRRRSRLPRILALMACTLVAVYAGSPVASAVQVAAAIQRGDAAALAQHVDWTTLRPALDAALTAEMQRNARQPMPDFITAMARDKAERLASPTGVALLLNEQMAAGGAQPARDMLSRLRMLETGVWEVTLNSGHAPDRSARLTLALTDAMRLRWDVQAIEFSSQPPARWR